MTFFRYPGGKKKIKKHIYYHLNHYTDSPEMEYREPFFGGGSIGLYFLQQNSRWNDVWINDRDLGIASLWTCVIRYPKELKRMVKKFTPSVEAFDEYKKILTDEDPADLKEWAFMKLAIHQMSYSGLGVKAGGPIGGKEQKSDYKVDCRWSPDYICKRITDLHKFFGKFNVRNDACTNYDFSYLLKDDKRALVYLDPPYYVKGSELYQVSFEKDDHKRLAGWLKETHHAWILSYDNCQEICDYYHWANRDPIDVTYSINTKNEDRTSVKKSEFLIYSDTHKDLMEWVRVERAMLPNRNLELSNLQNDSMHQLTFEF